MDIERFFDLDNKQMQPSAQALGKRKRGLEECDILDDQWIEGKRKSRDLLRSCSSVALDQSSR